MRNRTPEPVTTATTSYVLGEGRSRRNDQSTTPSVASARAALRARSPRVPPLAYAAYIRTSASHSWLIQGRSAVNEYTSFFGIAPAAITWRPNLDRPHRTASTALPVTI